MNLLLRSCFIFTLLSYVPWSEMPARAEGPPVAPQMDANSDQGVIPFVVEQFRGRRNRYPGDEGKNHTMVKAPFRDVVADASRGTVQILCDGKPVALGTVVRADGYVLTKASELSGRITCRLHGDKEVEARRVGIHDDSDLALLKIDAKGLSPVLWSREKSPPVGSFLATSGTEGQALAIGVVSVEPRTIAAQSGVLGIAVGQTDDGPRVDQVLEGTSAAKAGLRVNDVIVRINDRVVTTREALIDTVGSFRPGDHVRLKVRRGEEVLDISTTLGNRSIGSRRDFQNRLGGELSERRGGFSQALQHDTVLRPRECGGPLVDLDGHVVGINIARAERVASYAIPTPMVLDVLGELMPRAVAQEKPVQAKPVQDKPVAPAAQARSGRVTAARPVR